MALESFRDLLELSRSGRQAHVLTLIEAPDGEERLLGNMLIIPDNGPVRGMIADQKTTAAILDKVAGRDWKNPHIITCGDKEQYKVFWDSLTAAPRALVLGAGHISQPLVDILALIGFEITVVDDRPDFANKQRFPKATAVICQNFATALENLDVSVYDTVVIVTRGHRYDMDCLRTVLAYPASYVGMIGSQRRVKGIVEALAEEGVSRERLASLKAPIGLDIGAQTPAEIALSIAAEIVAALRGADGRPLSSKRR